LFGNPYMRGVQM